MEPETNGDNRRSDGTFGPGNNANPAGRPPGVSIKDRVRKFLEENPGDMEDFVSHFVKRNRELAWQMLEGRPQQDVTSGGEKINPNPIYGGASIQGHDSNKEDIQPDQANTGS